MPGPGYVIPLSLDCIGSLRNWSFIRSGLSRRVIKTCSFSSISATHRNSRSIRKDVCHSTIARTRLRGRRGLGRGRRRLDRRRLSRRRRGLLLLLLRVLLRVRRLWHVARQPLSKSNGNHGTSSGLRSPSMPQYAQPLNELSHLDFVQYLIRG